MFSIEEHIPIITDQPALSPDLNAIEMIWSIMKTEIEIKSPSNIHELELNIKET